MFVANINEKHISIYEKSDILFFLFVIALFLPFFISDTIYEWYKSFNAIHGMVMSFVKFAILATLGEMLGLRISTGVYHNKTFGIIPRMVIWGVLGMGINMAMIIFQKALPFSWNIWVWNMPPH